MQRPLASGEITTGHAKALLSVVNPADQRVLFGKLMGQGLSVRQTEQLANELNGGSRAASTKPSAPKQDNRDPNYVSIEQQFIDAFGTKVKLSGNFNKGTITIDYFTKDDLDRIYNIIIGNRR
jgi:ParB family chromosome partitioning protein